MGRKKPRKFGLRNLIGVGVAGVILMSGGYLVWQNKGKQTRVETYQVKEVIDGDTFVTSEDQHIRLAALEAPEGDRCGAREAFNKLNELILGRQLVIKVKYLDQYRRLVSYVYTDEGMVNSRMLESGWAYYSRPPGDAPEELKHGSDVARMEKRGIYSSRCTQVESPDPKCKIKGNVSTNNYGRLYYRYPGCRLYGQTVVELYRGDRWFCSAGEAVKEGYARAEDCGR